MWKFAGGDDGNPIDDLIGGAGDFINGVSGAVNFASDPAGATFKMLQDAASGLAHDVLPALTKALTPNLSLDWFVQAYAVSFAASILVAVVLLIPQFLRTARGTQSGRDLAESLGLYFTVFLVGAMFGPALGQVLIQFFHALSNSFIAWGIETSTGNVVTQLQEMIDSTDPAGLTGGVFIAILLMLCLVIALLLVLVMLLVQLVTLYFTGVLLPLGLVWIIDPTRRSFGMRIVYLWIGVLAAHPVLFFLLGFAFTMLSGATDTFGGGFSDPLQKLVTLFVAVLAIGMAALSPVLLMKFAPIIPTGAGGSSGPSFGPQIGAGNLSDASRKYSDGPARGGDRSMSDNRRETGPTIGNPEPVTAGAPGMSQAGQKMTAGAEGNAATPAVAGAGAGAGTASATGGAAAGGGAAAAGEGAAAMGATGAAESSTGVGAVVGVPTLIAAAGAAAAQKAVQLNDKVADQATAPMDDTGEQS